MRLSPRRGAQPSPDLAAPASEPLFPAEERLNRRVWAVIFLVLAINLVACRQLKIEIAWAEWLPVWLCTALLVGLNRVYTSWRPDRTIAVTTQCMSQIILFSFAGGVLSYVSSALDFPLRDRELIAADGWLGFHWFDYMAWIRARAGLSHELMLSYVSIKPQFILVILALFFSGKRTRLREFTWAIILSGVLCVAVSVVFPAVGGYVHYDIDMRDFGDMPPAAGRLHEQDFTALRGGSYHHLNADLQGLISFPSYHATLACLIVYAAWPIRYWRALILALNLALLVSTPVEGGHYLMDVLAGIAIAAVILLAIRRLLNRPINRS